MPAHLPGLPGCLSGLAGRLPALAARSRLWAPARPGPRRQAPGAPGAGGSPWRAASSRTASSSGPGAGRGARTFFLATAGSPETVHSFRPVPRMIASYSSSSSSSSAGRRGRSTLSPDAAAAVLEEAAAEPPPDASASSGGGGGGPAGAAGPVPGTPAECFVRGRPRSLALAGGAAGAGEAEASSGPAKDSQMGALLWMLGFYSKESQMVRGATRLLEATVQQAGDPRLFRAVGLADDFRGRHALLCLHVWMVLHRLKRQGPDAKALAQDYYDYFQYDVEKRVHAEGVKVRVSKWLKELEKIFYGSAMAFDKAVDRPGGALADALWRNTFASEGDRAGAQALARYVRREVASLALTDLDAVLRGEVAFNRSLE